MTMKISAGAIVVVFTSRDRLLWRSFDMKDGTEIQGQDMNVTGVIALAASHQRTSTFTVLTKQHMH